MSALAGALEREAGRRSIVGSILRERRLVAAMGTVGSLVLLAKIAGAVKEAAVARQFGAGDSLDAFLIALVVPAAALTILTNSVHAAVIPTYVEVRERDGEDAAHRLSSSVVLVGALLSVALAFVLFCSAPVLLRLVAPGFGGPKLELTRSLFFIFLPAIPLGATAALFAAILNARRRFAITSLTPIVTPASIFVAVLVFGGALGVAAAAWAFAIGAAIEATVLAVAASRDGSKFLVRGLGWSRGLRQIGRQMSPMIAGSALTSGNTLIDQTMATCLGAGSVAALSYGNRVVAVVFGVTASAVSTVALPHFSSLVARQDWTAVRRSLRTYRRLALVVMVPATVGLIALSHPIVRLLFERGAFTSAETDEVAFIQQLLLLQIPFCSIGILYVRLISALKANAVLMWGTAISFGLNVALNYLFMRWFGTGGIALATSLVYVVSLGYVSLAGHRRLREAEAAGAAA